MIPGPAVTIPGFPATYRELTKGAEEFLLDYEYGGIALNDPSQGFWVQQWYARVIDGNVIQIKDSTGDWITYFTTVGDLSEMAFAFDNNMNVFLTYRESGIYKFRWFDPTIETYTIVELPDGVRSPRCCFDEKREALISTADTILAYIRDDILCVRVLRDRYLVEYQLTDGIPSDVILVDVNMNNIYRLQFALGYP